MEQRKQQKWNKKVKNGTKKIVEMEEEKRKWNKDYV